MSTTPDLPGPSETELGHDDDAMFDELAARAGAALRRPAPADGMRVIAARRRRQQARNAVVVGGIAVAILVGALAIVPNRADDPQPPADSVPDSLPATTVEPEPALPAMWPQSSDDEVSQAQELADAGDPAYTWQVEPRLLSPFADAGSALTDQELWEYLTSPGAEIPERFIREELGWDEFMFNTAVPGLDPHHLMYLRCAPNETNPLYPIAPDGQQGPGGERCAPTIDELHYEAVTLDLSQPVRKGADGIWVVSGSRTRFAQVDPNVSEENATVYLEKWLQKRIDGELAEGYVDAQYLFGGPDELPLLYATTNGSRYERFEIERQGEPRWPYGEMDFTVRLFADGGETVVEQKIRRTYENTFNNGDGETTENGQRVPPPES